MRPHRHRADAGPAAAVRDAESLVQVEVRHVGAEPAGRRAAHQRVQVRAVEIHLAAVRMHDLANLADVRLVDAVRRRVGDHDRREVHGVLRRLRGEVVEIDVALGVGRDHNDFAAGHVRGGGVGAVGGAGHEHHVPVSFAAARVIGADRDQPGELALGAGVRLQRAGVVPSENHCPICDSEKPLAIYPYVRWSR